MKPTLKGWSIRVYEQIHWPPYKRFVAIAERIVGNKRLLLNAEGDTREEAEQSAKRAIQQSSS